MLLKNFILKKHKFIIVECNAGKIIVSICLLLFQAIETLVQKGVLDNDPMEIARFLHTTKRLWPCKKREFLERRYVITSDMHLIKTIAVNNSLAISNTCKNFF